MVTMKICLTLFLFFTSTFAFGKAKTAIELFEQLSSHLEEGDKRAAQKSGLNLIYAFPDHPLSIETRYHLGCLALDASEYLEANRHFSFYVNASPLPAHYVSGYEKKLLIAEALAGGEKIRIGDSSLFPKWGSGQTLALELCDEIFTAFPQDDLGAKALYRKGWLLLQQGHFKEALDCCKKFIKHFHSHPLLPEIYLHIGEIYVIEANSQPNDPSYLELQRINHAIFKEKFPSDPRLLLSTLQLSSIEETLAEGLYEIARFYEKKREPTASSLYLKEILDLYPHSRTAEKAKVDFETIAKKQSK